MIRSVLFDTETTGLDPLNGDRVIEAVAWRRGKYIEHYRRAAQRADRLDALFAVEVSRWDGEAAVRLPPRLRGVAAGVVGNLVGGSRESVNKHLQAWHRAGLIRLARGSIVIRDPAAIERLI